MAIARNEIVQDGVKVYHCVSKCVRHAYLCGTESYSGKGYDHRKDWIRSRIRQLSAGYAVEVTAYSIMSNHLHVVLRTQPDWVDKWSDKEVAERWLKLSAKSRQTAETDNSIREQEINQLTGSADRIAELRDRMCSVGWFMRSLNEYIARRANKEDDCKGRFWEGRFVWQELLDEPAVLACMAHVDLNPIRVGLVETPEESDYTSIKERIEERNSSSKKTKLQDENWLWLCPIGNERPDGRTGILPMSRDEYLALIDWTGRQIRLDKAGEIPSNIAPLLDRLEINKSQWATTVKEFGSLFHRVAGRAESIMNAARQDGKSWLAGIKAGKRAFSND